MTLRRIAGVCALIGIGTVIAAHGQVPVVTDHQIVPIEQTPDPQEVGPISLLGLDIPEGFPVELFLDVTHTVRVDIGSQSFTSVGVGGTISSTGRAFLEAGRSYVVTEQYDFAATVDSVFIDGEFTIHDEVTWEFVAPHSGRYQYAIDGVARDLNLAVTGDVAGATDLELIEDVIQIEIVTTREILADTFMTYAGAFLGTFDRTARAEFIAEEMPPWDIDADGVTDIVDLVRVARAFGQIGEAIEGDTDANGRVDIIDLVTVAAHFGETLRIAAAPARVTGGRTAGVHPTVTRGDDGRATYVLDMTPGAVAGIVADVGYDRREWELVEVAPGDRLLDAVSLRSHAPAGVARLVAVSVPPRDGGPRAGSLARFTFRPLSRDADVSRLRLRAIQLAGPDGVRIGVHARDTARARVPVPAGLVSGSNYPNPFNPETWVPFSVSEAGDVTMTVYAADGSTVRVLRLGTREAGEHHDRSRAAYWDGRNDLGERAHSGVYFYRLESRAGSATGRMVIAK